MCSLMIVGKFPETDRQTDRHTHSIGELPQSYFLWGKRFAIVAEGV